MTRASSLRRWLIVLGAAVLVWASLAIGSDTGVAELVVDEPSPERFVADVGVVVLDEEATAAAKEAAAAEVPEQFSEDFDVTIAIQNKIFDLFEQVESNTVAANPPLTVEVDRPEIPDPIPTTTTTVAEEAQATTTTTVALPTTEVSGLLYLDRTGDGLHTEEATETVPEVDAPAVDIDVIITDSEGNTVRVRTDAAGMYSASGISADGSIVVEVDTRDPQFPSAFALSTANNPQVFEVSGDEPIEVEPIGFTPFTVPIAEQVEALVADYPIDTNDPAQPSLATLVEVAIGDVWREAADEESQLDQILEATTEKAVRVLEDGIHTGELFEIRQEVLTTRIFIDVDLPRDLALAAENSARSVVAAFLEANLLLDEDATAAARVAAQDVVEVTVDFRPNDIIVNENEIVTQVQLAAISELGLLRRTTSQFLSLFVAVVVLIGVLMFYISRFRPGLWASSRRVTLLGVLLVLLALSIRGSVALSSIIDGLEIAGGYAVPAAAFGVMVAILFDARMAVIMAAAAAGLTALATGDPGFTLFAMLSGFVAIPFVSSISRRSDFGSAVAAAAFGSAVVAAATAFFFHVPLVDESALTSTVLASALVAGLVALVTSLAAGMAVTFFELTFDITTSLRLLDLTNRNHPALQLLQDEAWGTFNHSLMVGTLADKAASSIGANNLLARAAAYYHDLGKTENPTYFIENQFGISNPHDQLPPDESAAIIRQHVRDGVSLAREYRIPSEVQEGILSHHGDGIMRFFYEKAKSDFGEAAVNVDHYRHDGHKPRTREMAILMMADALEGATRAVFSNEDPTPERIINVVERVVGEKVNDGQLSDSDLTLGELTDVKAAFVEALVGHYHQRIPYPNFPDADGLSGGAPKGIGPSPQSDDSDTGAAATPDEESVDSSEGGSDVIPMRRHKER